MDQNERITSRFSEKTKFDTSVRDGQSTDKNEARKHDTCNLRYKLISSRSSEAKE
jgi:hypothetical protein